MNRVLDMTMLWCSRQGCTMHVWVLTSDQPQIQWFCSPACQASSTLPEVEESKEPRDEPLVHE